MDDERGSLVRQADVALPQAEAACQTAVLDLSGLRGGDYRLYLVVYAWETGERLSAAAGERVLVYTFTRE